MVLIQTFKILIEYHYILIIQLNEAVCPKQIRPILAILQVCNLQRKLTEIFDCELLPCHS